jgi:sec-independent protein translocase protein TatA
MAFGVTEMLIILAIVLVIFGAGKLPSVMGDLAKGVRNFKAGMKDDPEPPPTAAPAPPIARLTGPRDEGDRSASA